MLRQKVRAIILNKKLHPLLKKLTRLMIFVGILWILSFPYIARRVFTSENALNGEFLDTTFSSESSSYPTYKTLQEKIQ